MNQLSEVPFYRRQYVQQVKQIEDLEVVPMTENDLDEVLQIEMTSFRSPGPWACSGRTSSFRLPGAFQRR